MLTHGFTARVRASVAFITIFSLLASYVVLPAGNASADTEVFTSNPGFETGTGNAATGWTTGSFGTITAAYTIANGVANVHSGNKAGRVQVTAITGAADAKWVSPAITVSAGQALTFSDYYKSTVPTSVFIYDNLNGVTWIGDAASSSAAFTQFHGQTYLVPAGVTSIQVGHTIAAVGTLTTDDYSLILSSTPSAFSQGLVTLTFDDGWDSFWTVASSSLNAHNFKATNYIITGPDGSSIGNTPNSGYMSTTQLLQLQNAGYDIAAHTRAHLDLAKDDPAAHGYPTGRAAMWTGEINGSRTDLLSHSFNNVDSFAYPYGSYCAPSLSDCASTTVQNAGAVNVLKPVADAGFLGARSVDQGYNLASDLGNDNKFKLKMQHVTNNTTAADINGWIDYAVANKVWLIIMFHNVRAGNETTGAANAQCVEPVLDAQGNEVVPAQTQPDADCTTNGVLTAAMTHLATKPAGTVQTMHQVLTGNFAPPPADTTAPVITVPGNMSVVATSSTSIGAVVTFSATASDTNPVNPAVTCVPTSGSTFALGSTTVTCTAVDAANNHATSTFVVGVTAPAPVNAAPTANAQSVSTAKNTSVSITLTATDPDSSTLTFATSSNPAHGSLSGSGASLTYSPTPGYSGADSFTFTANDGTSTSAQATVSITVNAGPNHAPTTNPQDVTVAKNGSVAITLTGSDSDSDTLTFATSTNPSHGTLTGSGAHLTYTPNTDYVGSDSFDFTVSDGMTGTLPTTISITVNDPSAPAPSSNNSGGGNGGGGGTVLGLIGQVVQNIGGLVLGAQTSALTEAQINSILDLLKSFNADQSVIDNVSKSLHGQSTGGSTGGFHFTKLLQTGSTGNEVTELQKWLTAKGFYKGPVTGYFGSLTKAAVMACQKNYGLDPVGVVGPKTRAKLNGQ